MPNVAEKPTIDDHVPFEIRPKAKYRSGDQPDQKRIEEIRMRGVRPGDAERIERLERELDLEEEFGELRRVWAVAVLRANVEPRKQVLRRIMADVYNGRLLPYQALKRLHELELIDEDLGFARVREKTPVGSYRFELILYDGRTPKKALEYRPGQSGVKLKTNLQRSAWYATLPK